MFLFLSKLIPLFIYPLGLACVLLAIALIGFWKRPRLTRVAIVIALSLLLLGGNRWVSAWVVQSLERQHLPTQIPQAEAIVVLGGAIKTQSPPRPWMEVSEAGDRVLYGAKLYREGKAPLVILSGGRIDWREGGRPEATDMAELMVTMGVPPAAMIIEPDSLNTYENAVNVRKILQSLGIRRVLLVTSATHMPRSRLIFQKQGIESIPAPTDFLITPSTLGDRSLESVVLNLLPEAEYLNDLSRALKEYIGMAVYRLKGWL
jgi:uncharacterized SAM-binding protein YcdF (DUF218 family)